MKDLIYDLITGCAIIGALFIVTNVMKANQNFIFSSVDATTNLEQVYYSKYDNDTINTYAENTYTIADVYGTFRSLLNTDGEIIENTIFRVRNIESGGSLYPSIEAAPYDVPATENVNIINQILVDNLNNRPTLQLKREKKTEIKDDNTYLVYIFTVFTT